MASDAGTLESLIAQIRDGGWEGLEKSLDDAVTTKATGHLKSNGLTQDDKKDINTAWFAFSQTPGGRMALQHLVDRTLNRPAFYVHLGMSAEQIAIYGAHKEGQNFLVQMILNHIREAMEEPTKQRDV